MPAQTVQAPISLAKSLKAHARDPVQTRADFSDLPPGLDGVAELTSAKIGVYKDSENNRKSGLANQRFVYLGATVVSPETHTWRPKRWLPRTGASANGQPAGEVVYDPPTTSRVRGRQFNQTLPLCAEVRKVKGQDTTISADENAQVMLNELKMLGGPECCNSLAKLPDNATMEQENAALNAILQALVKARIRFRFATRVKDPTSQYPEPGSWPPDWKGVEGVGAPSDPAAGTVDNTGAAGSTPGDHPDAAEPPAAAAGPTQADVDALVARCNAKEPAAQRELVALAVANGWDEASLTADDVTWEQVGQAALEPPPAAEGDQPAGEAEGEPSAEGEGEEVDIEIEGGEEEWSPKVKEVYGFKAPVKGKDGKVRAGAKVIDCAVKAVDDDKRTVDLLNGVDKKTVYKKVPWDKLVRE